jgi:magnesium-transporting ATPase (P-type)
VEGSGAPTEAALVTAALKAGLVQQGKRPVTRLDVIPFSSEQKFMATLHRDPRARRKADHSQGGAGKGFGALLSPAAAGPARPALTPIFLGREEERIASQGQRLLAVAVRRVDGRQGRLSMDDVDEGFTILGSSESSIRRGTRPSKPRPS